MMYEGKMYDVRFMYEGDAAALIWGAAAVFEQVSEAEYNP